MASTVIQPVADRLAELLDGIGVNANTWADNALPAGTDVVAEIEIPDIARTEPEQAESQLGADDWHLEFVVTLYADLRQARASQQRLVVAVEQWIAAVDDDRQLGTLALDAAVTDAKRVYHTDPNRPLVGYETTVAVWKLV